MGYREKRSKLGQMVFRAMRHFTQALGNCYATASDADLKYRARHCHTLFVLQIVSQAINLK